MESGIRGWIKRKLQTIREKRPQYITEPDQFRLIQEINGYQGTYDGSFHSFSIITDEGCRIEYSRDQVMWVLTAPSVREVGVHKFYAKVTRNKRVEQCEAYIEIWKRNVILESASAKKEYDGIPLKEDSVFISGDGLAKGESISAWTDSLQTVVGSCTNTIHYEFTNKEIIGNYAVIKKEGVLEVISRHDKYNVGIRANSACFEYDGKEHSVSGFEQDKFRNGEVEYCFNGLKAHASLQHAGTVQTIISGSFNILDSEGNDVTDQFNLYPIPGTLTIFPRRVTLKSASISQEYNGYYLANPQIDILENGFCEGEKPSFNVYGRQRIVGKSENFFDYTFPESVCSEDYMITVEYGVLEVVSRKDKFKVNIHMRGGEYLFDGNERIISGIEEDSLDVNGCTYAVSSKCEPVCGTDAGIYRYEGIPVLVISDELQNAVTDQFDIIVNPAELIIRKRTIVLTSASAEKEYDGTALEKNEVSITGDGLINRDRIIVSVSGSQTLVGSCPNMISYEFLDGTNAENYSVEKNEGTLEVLNRIEKFPVFITTEDRTYNYDGTEHHVEELIYKRFVYNGKEFKVTGVSVSASLLHAGSIAMNVNGSAGVVDENGNDVRHQFDIQVVPGTLFVKPRKVILNSASAHAEYNGDDLRENHIEVGGEGFVEGDEPSFVISGKQRVVGKSENYFEYFFPSGVRTEDYHVIVKYGTLEVHNRKDKYTAVIHLNSLTCLYDAKDHCISGAVENTINVDGKDYRLSIIDKPIVAREAGKYSHDSLASYTVLDSEDNDVTDQFELIVQHGYLIIEKRNVILISDSCEKEYDGKPLTAENLRIDEDGFAEGEHVQVVFHGSQILPGESSNAFTYAFTKNNQWNNYNVSKVEGTLTVINRIHPYEVEFLGQSLSVKYDGEEKTLPEFDCLEFFIDDVLFIAKGISNVVTGIEEGVYTSELSDELIICDAQGNDVTKQFHVNVIPGQLTILHNPEYDQVEEEIDDYDIAIHNILKEVSGETETDSSEPIKKYTRKELEALYKDTKELLNVKTDIDPEYMHILDHWEQKTNLADLRNRIADQIPEVSLLSEISISDQEFKILINYLHEKCLTNPWDYNYVLADILLTIAMIQIGIRYYETNYWPQVGKILHLNIGPNERKWIGDTVTKTLLVLGKPVYSEKEYVTNILMHCFITDSYSDRFFNYLFSFYRLDLERDVSGLQETDTDYICDSIINPYAKRKQMLSEYTAMSVRADREYCRQTIEKALYMIDKRFWDEELYEEESLTGRLRERFDEWSDHSDFYHNEKLKNRQQMAGEDRIRLYRSPHLSCVFDHEKFVVTLPSQMIPVIEDTNLPDVRWFIISSERREYRCELSEGYSGYKTKEKVFTIAPDEIFCRFVFLLFSGKTLLRSFYWDAQEASFFSDRWEGIRADNLIPGKVYAFSKNQKGISSEAVLYEGWECGLPYYELGLKEGDFVQVYGEDNYYVGRIPSPGLSSIEMVEGVSVSTENDKDIPVYRKSPQVIIEIDEGQLPGVAVFANGTVNRLADMHFIDIHVGHTLEKKYYFIDAGNLRGIHDGFNDVYVDYPNSMKRLRAEFFMLHGFKYEFLDAPYIYKTKGFLSVSIPSKEGELLLHTSEKTVPFEMVELTKGILSIELKDITMNFSVPMLLTSWDRETWQYIKSPDIWHNDLKSILYIKYPGQSLTMHVGGDRKYDSRSIFNVRADGIFNCDLTRLKSYFDQKAIIDTIFIETEEGEKELLRIIQRSFLVAAKLIAYPFEHRIKAILDIIGKNEYYADLYCEDVLLAEKEQIENNEIIFEDIDVDTADYTIKVYESEDEFGFDEDFDFIGERTQSLINTSDLVGGRMKINNIITLSGQILEFPPEYDYYIFLEEQTSSDKYNGVIAGVFHKSSVMYASRVAVQIRDLSDPHDVIVEKLTDGYSRKSGLTFDLKKSAIVDSKEEYRGDERYIILMSKKCIWSIEYIGANTRLLNMANEWMEEYERLKNRPFTIWKN